MKAILMMLLIILIPILPASSQLLTEQEIESAIGSKPSYTKAEVKALITGILDIVEEELETAQKEVVQKHEDKVQQIKDICNFQLTQVESDRDFWRIVSIVEFGACVIGGIAWAISK